MLYHITYRDRWTGKTEVGRVSIADDRTVPAHKLRQRAISAASIRFPQANYRSISAVRVSR